MPRGVDVFQQWPDMAPYKRGCMERHATDNGSGSLMTLVGRLVPSASLRAQRTLFSEVQRQFSAPRLPTPARAGCLDELLPEAHPDIAGLSSPELVDAVISLRADMAWRWLRYERLFNPRLPRYELDPEFIAWLRDVPPACLQSWGQAAHLSARLGAIAPQETALRLARMRPLPLDVALAWHEWGRARALAAYAPSRDQAVLDYLVTACLQRMDAYYMRDRLAYRRIRGSVLDVECKGDAREALHSPGNSQLTISDRVFREAEQASAAAASVARLERETAVPRGKPGEDTDGTALVPAGAVGEECNACREGHRPLARSPRNMRFPPFVVGCRCHFAFEWEGAAVSEADYEGELSAWAASWARGVSYPFPGRLVLFRLAEQDRRRASRTPRSGPAKRASGIAL